ncbi:unnamed protein product [Chrysodeixis includens]|uniref:DUF4200 domain-containing protein n=1 Tax=Chrysodeixis includens TaxID=689277 RepID=A0A9N8KT37_CHRIL|nr:unnamed protein product [Chrysodeixis includens]
MNNPKKKKGIKRYTRKTIAGIKLPPLEPIPDSDIKTIVDVDPAFYTLIDGRPIRPSTSIHQYKHNIKNVALNRTLHGFLVDEILRIDKEIETERNCFDAAYKHFEEYQNSFDKFLADDNNKTIAIMQRSDALAKELANQTEECKRLKELPSPKLYFETPDQLLTIFGLLEKQNLNYLLFATELSSEKNRFLRTVEKMKQTLRQELDFIQEKNKEIQDTIKWNEDREVERKEVFFKILKDKIKDLVSSSTVLQIFNYVDFAYQHLIAPNEVKLTSLDMVQALEREYDNLSMCVSAYDLDMIKQIEKETYEHGNRELKQAKEASKLLKDVDKLSKRLKSSYEPTRRKMYD